MSQPLRFGVLGASKFALTTMSRAIHEAEGAALVALATSSEEKAEPFRAFCPDLQVFESYDALISSDAIDAVYIPLPNHMHVEWTLKALENGKHALTEKPIAMTAAEIDTLIAKRDETGLLAAEAYMIVHHPQWIRAKELLADGTIGKLVHVDAAFSFNNTDMGNIRNRPETGGGSIRDIGVYTYGSVRYATGREPVEITHTNIRFENDVDVFAEMTADFGEFTYHAYTSTRMCPMQEVRFHGDAGVIVMKTPFNAASYGNAEIEIRDGANNLRIERFTSARQYVQQVENFVRSARTGEPYPWTLEYARGTQAMIDAVFEHDRQKRG